MTKRPDIHIHDEADPPYAVFDWQNILAGLVIGGVAVILLCWAIG